MLTREEAIKLRDHLINKVFQKNGWSGEIILEAINEFTEKHTDFNELMKGFNIIYEALNRIKDKHEWDGKLEDITAALWCFIEDKKGDNDVD